MIGPVFNLNFFYSPLAEEGELELLGVDWRFESSLDGHVRLPAPQQMTMPIHQQIPEMTVVGHNTATIRESLLEKAFELGEKFIKASKEHYDPGIIGPFCLQTCIDKDMNYYIYDVAPRLGGGTNVHVSVGHPTGMPPGESPCQAAVVSPWSSDGASKTACSKSSPDVQHALSGGQTPLVSSTVSLGRQPTDPMQHRSRTSFHAHHETMDAVLFPLLRPRFFNGWKLLALRRHVLIRRCIHGLCGLTERVGRREVGFPGVEVSAAAQQAKHQQGDDGVQDAITRFFYCGL